MQESMVCGKIGEFFQLNDFPNIDMVTFYLFDSVIKLRILPYVGSYSGEKCHQFLQEPCIIALSKSVEMFFMVSISDMPTINIGKI